MAKNKLEWALLKEKETKMSTIYDVNPNKHIAKVKEELKKLDHIKPPAWAVFVKTGVHKERPPKEEDWWFTRSAAVLRAVGKLGPIGTAKLRTKYGGRKNRGVRPDHTFKGSGNIIRKVLQQLQASGLVEENKKGLHKGRILTAKGKSLLDKTAGVASKEARSADKSHAHKEAKAHAPKENKEHAPREHKPAEHKEHKTAEHHAHKKE